MTYNLRYFPIPAMAEPVRLQMSLGGHSFEDEVVTFAEWPALKPTMGFFGTMPVVKNAAGREMTQARALTRMFGKMTVIDGHKMYPDDIMEAFSCDEVMDATMDIQAKFAKTFAMKGDEQKAARENMLKEGGLCFDIVTQVQNLVASYGKQYMATDFLTVADVMLFTWLNTIRSGFLDNVDLDFLSKFPELEKRVDLIAAHPSVVAYYTTKQDSPLYACFLPKLTVAYFDGRGLAEVPRMMLSIAGVAFEDKRYPISLKDGEGPPISRADFSAFSADAEAGLLASNLGRLPILKTPHGDVGGSKGMRNYIASTFGLAGTSAFERAQVETICDVVNDISTAFGKQEDKEKWFTVSAKDGCKQGERQLQWFLQGLEALVGENGFSVGSGFTTADIVVYHFFGDIGTTKGMFGSTEVQPMNDGKKTAICLISYAPKILRIVEEVGKNSKMRAYLEAREKNIGWF